FGSDVEGPFLNGLTFFRAFLRIPGKNRRVPDYELDVGVDGEVRPATLTGDGVLLLRPQALKSTETAKEYRIFGRKDAKTIERNLARERTSFGIAVMTRQDMQSLRCGRVSTRISFGNQ